jgi:AraC-like DNA-binding protein
MTVLLKPNENIYIERKKLDSNYVMPTMQAAMNYYTLSYLISGDRKWFSYDHIFISHAGNVGFGFPNILHRTFPMSDAPYDRFLIKYRIESLQPAIDLIGAGEFKKMCTDFLHFNKEGHQKIFQGFNDMLNEYNRHSPYSQFILEGMLQRLFLTIYENKLPDETSNAVLNLPSYDSRIHDAMIYIEEHLYEELPIKEVAANVCLSVTYFSKLFKKVAGCSYTDYVVGTRLQHAQLLLYNTKLTISEIAQKVGFANGNYLCTVFKNHYHISPRDFRKENQT